MKNPFFFFVERNFWISRKPNTASSSSLYGIVWMPSYIHLCHREINLIFAYKWHGAEHFYRFSIPFSHVQCTSILAFNILLIYRSRKGIVYKYVPYYIFFNVEFCVVLHNSQLPVAYNSKLGLSWTHRVIIYVANAIIFFFFLVGLLLFVFHLFHSYGTFAVWFIPFEQAMKQTNCYSYWPRNCWMNWNLLEYFKFCSNGNVWLISLWMIGTI